MAKALKSKDDWAKVDKDRIIDELNKEHDIIK